MNVQEARPHQAAGGARPRARRSKYRPECGWHLAWDGYPIFTYAKFGDRGSVMACLRDAGPSTWVLVSCKAEQCLGRH